MDVAFVIHANLHVGHALLQKSVQVLELAKWIAKKPYSW